jgi:hypothetical protein
MDRIGRRLEGWRRGRHRARAAADAAEVDRLLAKIKAGGMPALSGRERRFLLDHSRDQAGLPPRP